jgi:alkylhydroperoxidase/carboxymuconolactone decarboxylase family protein YurZ
LREVLEGNCVAAFRQPDFYLRRGLESGLTGAQITEALTHLGFYAGWARR